MTKRHEGKKMLGGWVAKELMDAVVEWRKRNPGKLNTDFVVDAAMEKLDAAGIKYDKAAVLVDGRSRMENRSDVRPVKPVNSKPTSVSGRLLKKGVVSVQDSDAK